MANDGLPPSIALLAPSFRGGGAEGANVRLANELVRREQSVDLLVLQASGPWRERVDARARVVDLGSRRALAGLLPLARYLSARQPSALMAGPSHVAVLAILARLFSRAHTSILVLEHNDPIASQMDAKDAMARLLPAAMRLTYPRADRLLAVSQGAASSLAKLLRVPPDRVAVLYNGIDLGPVQDGARQLIQHPWLTPQRDPLVVSVGRLAPQKGYPDLLRAFALLRERTPARLVILGSGSQQPELESLVDGLGLSGAVEFRGFDPNPYAWMAKASLFVMASRYEGFGVVLLEALACGAPVVATDCPSGPGEILAGGRYGMLTPVGDPPALAAAMARLLSDGDLARRLRAEGPGRAAEFSIERTAEQFLEVLRSLRVRASSGGLSR